jgi:hypothetical protein
LRSVLALAALSAAIPLLSAQPAGAIVSSISVFPEAGVADGVAGDNRCSLREAVSLVNGTLPNTNHDCDAPHSGTAFGTTTPQIHLDTGTYALTLGGADEDANATGDLDLTHDVAFFGNGAGASIIDASGLGDRAIDITAGHPTVSFSNLTITGGHAPDGVASGTTSGNTGENGGGIHDAVGSTLSLHGVTLTNNSAGDGGTSTAAGGYGGTGGGIYAMGAVTIDGSTISSNRAGAGAPGAGTGAGGWGGSAGGVRGQDGELTTVTSSLITGNKAGDGGDGASSSSTPGSGGPGGDGGAIDAGTVEISGSTVSGNSAGAAGAGGEHLTAGANSAQGGGGGRGGAIWSNGDHVTISASTITDNRAGSGGAGGASQGTDATGPGGSGGTGGALFARDPVSHVNLTGSTVSGNSAGSGGSSPHGTGGGGGNAGGIELLWGWMTIDTSTLSGNSAGNGGDGATGGAGGIGGAIRTGHDTLGPNVLTFTNSTIAGNHAGAGGSSSGGVAGGAGGAGGGIVFRGGQGTLLHMTIAGNGAGAGGAGTPNGANGSGGGIAFYAVNSNDALTASNSVVANNTPKQCGGTTFTNDGSYDVSFPDGTCPGTIANPLLQALANNGGTTQTMALGEGSPAIDLVPTTGANCPAVDQRGVTRPQRAACDAGAFEAEPAPPPPPDQGQQNPPGGATPTASPGGSPVDKTPPIVKLLVTRQKLLKALKKGYLCFFSDNELGTALAELDASGKDAKGAAVTRTRVASGKLTITKTGKQKLVLKFTKKAKRAFAKRKKVTLQLVLTVKDAAGNATHKGATVVLKR